MDNHQEINSKVAALESKVDMLETELSYLNELLVRCGFPEGIVTLKATVEELIAEMDEFHYPDQKSASDR